MLVFEMKLSFSKAVNVYGNFANMAKQEGGLSDVKPYNYLSDLIAGFLVIRINGNKVRHSVDTTTVAGPATGWICDSDQQDVIYKTDGEVLRCTDPDRSEVTFLIFVKDQDYAAIIDTPNLRRVHQDELDELLTIRHLSLHPRHGLSLGSEVGVYELSGAIQLPTPTHGEYNYPMVMEVKGDKELTDVYLSEGNVMKIRENPMFSLKLFGDDFTVKTSDVEDIRSLLSNLVYAKHAEKDSLHWVISSVPFVMALNGMQRAGLSQLADVNKKRPTWWFNKADNSRIRILQPTSVARQMHTLAGFKVRTTPLTDKEMVSLTFPDNPGAVSRIFSLL